MRPGTAERVLAVVAAGATLVAFIDIYVLKSKLATALRLPASVPTGVLFLVLFAVVGITMILAGRLSRHAAESARLRSESDRLQAESERLATQLDAERKRAKVADDELQLLVGKTARMASLRKQVIAVLTPQSRDESGIQRAIGISALDPESQFLREVLGDLVAEGIVQREEYGFNYALRRGPAPKVNSRGQG